MRLAGVKLLLFIITGTYFLPLLGQSAEQIRLLPDMLINLSGHRSADALVDEQDTGILDSTGKRSAPMNVFENSWHGKDLYFPMNVVIDLGVKHELSQIGFYDTKGDGPLSFAYRQNGQWIAVLQDDLKRYQEWVIKDVSLKSRYLRITFGSPSASLGELILYGNPLKVVKSGETPPKVKERAMMDQFIGINGFVDDPVEKLAGVGHLREYHQWQWDEGNGDPAYKGYPDHKIAWSPSWVSGSNWGWDFDDYYEKLKKAHIEIVPCIQSRASYLSSSTNERSDQKPIKDGADPSMPQAYAEHSSFLYQFVARYGFTKVDENRLKLRSDQEKRSGLGVIRYIENCNEPDKWWKGRDSFFTPFELAAMCSADLDGHKGALGPGHGILSADPKIKLVMGGLANPEIEYLKAMKLWADFHRDGEFPAHVINLHHYSNDTGGQVKKQPTVGISPEDDHLKEKFQTIVKFIRENLGGRELWVSEFGYDTNPKSIQRAPKIGTWSNEEVQAQWIVRSYLALAAAGVDRAQLYMLRDVNAANPTKYESSGLTTEKRNKHIAKISWFYVATMRYALSGTRFLKEIESKSPNVKIYRFSSENGDRQVDVLWCPSSKQAEVKDFRLSVSDAKQCKIIHLQAGEQKGREQIVGIENGKITVDVSEIPLFLEYSDK